MATHSELELSFTASGTEQTPFGKQKTSVRKLPQLAPHGNVFCKLTLIQTGFRFCRNGRKSRSSQLIKIGSNRVIFID